MLPEEDEEDDDEDEDDGFAYKESGLYFFRPFRYAFPFSMTFCGRLVGLFVSSLIGLLVGWYR